MQILRFFLLRVFSIFLLLFLLWLNLLSHSSFFLLLTLALWDSTGAGRPPSDSTALAAAGIALEGSGPKGLGRNS